MRTCAVGGATVIGGAPTLPETPRHVNPIDGDNPLGGNVSCDGTYSGDGLSMLVSGNNVNLELGANKFVGSIAKRDGANFSGTFSHEGKSFDFRCVVIGDAVDFTTGTKTYKLKKQAAANPLG